MEEALNGLGVATLVVLALAGGVIGFALARVLRRPGVVGALVGAVAGVATPFVLALLGVTVLAAGGLLLVALVGAIGAALIAGLVLMLLRRR